MPERAGTAHAVDNAVVIKGGFTENIKIGSGRMSEHFAEGKISW